MPPWSQGNKRRGSVFSLVVPLIAKVSHQLFLSVGMHAFIGQSVFDDTITVQPHEEACPQLSTYLHSGSAAPVQLWLQLV